MGDRPTIRIRGIYATALSALLPEHGFAVVEASPVIAERLGLRPDGGADVRLRDRPDHQAVRLEGPRRAAETVARALAELLPDAVPRELRGPAVWEVEFPGGSKRSLDVARSAVWPTLPGHHHLKIVAGDAVDRAEQELAAGRASADHLAAELRERFVDRLLRPGRAVATEHVKPDGREIRLPGQLVRFDGSRQTYSRRFRHGGTYDTLGAPKRGDDRGENEELAGSWVGLRRYLRADGSLIGELYNIQTPTEHYPHGARYLDLELDVARWPDGRVGVVDREDLDEAVRRGFLSERLAARAVGVAQAVAETLRRGEPVPLEHWR